MATTSYILEEQVLGGLAYEPSRAYDLPELNADHFSDQENALLYRSFLRARAQNPGLVGTGLAETMADLSTLPGAKTRIINLALSCENVAATVENAQQLIDYSVHRELVSMANRISYLAAGSDRTAHMTNMMRGWAQEITQHLSPGAQVAPHPLSPRAYMEELILADLIQDPGLVSDLADWLPADAFFSPNRQEIYQTLLNISDCGPPHQSNFPIEQHLKMARAGNFETVAMVPSLIEQFSSVNQVPYIAHLGATPIERGSSIETARDLLALHLRHVDGPVRREGGGERPLLHQGVAFTAPEIAHRAQTIQPLRLDDFPLY
ncbi:DnaB-like helicase N-terminal domain-containing protein [Actinomadura atramentaria]|uniref:DnaB-like helicase N-terminal domain-containing protein n=1 Tax=Actinomadura atramentaria TaxID=1990 RepID=UPI000373E750|nr:DnaB-like helicase N-terminal domain-containing protein [Actinomadura atramentaria]